MVDYKIYGKTFHILNDIKNFAKSINASTKFDKQWRIVLKENQRTKKNDKKIREFADSHNLNVYTEEYDGSVKNYYSNFARALLN